MNIGQKFLYSGLVLLVCIVFASQTAAPANSSGDGGSLPPELLRPQYGEEPRFPQDYVIGTLGRCDASEESHRYVRLITAGLAAGNGITEGVQFPEQKRLSVVQKISGLGTRSWRVGGGRVEPDGSVSYLIRFLGREQSITGELYLRQVESDEATGAAPAYWRVDDVLLENSRSLSEGKFSPAGTDMPAYERFF
jgi:hypothetical protein